MRKLPRVRDIAASDLSRRDLLRGAAGGLAGVALARPASGGQGGASEQGSSPIHFCLNASTVRGADNEVGVVEQIRIAAEVGFDAFEPWIRDVDRYVGEGGSLSDLAKRLRDGNLAVPSSIGFAAWGVDDPSKRREGLEEARRSMAIVAELGGTRIAAPPVGLTDAPYTDLRTLAERYGVLVDLGREFEVVPELEVWGFSKTFGRLGEVAYVAVECGRPEACILPDVYHLYKGGSGFDGLHCLNGDLVPVFHLNDYPADPTRESIGDADRVYPGDGVAPLDELMAVLKAIGFRGTFSLELFNRDYWNENPMEVARRGLDAMKAVARPLLS